MGICKGGMTYRRQANFRPHCGKFGSGNGPVRA